MKKHRYSLNLYVDTVRAIDEAARRNHTSRSAISRMFLELIQHVPIEQLQETSPILAYLGINKGVQYGNQQGSE